MQANLTGLLSVIQNVLTHIRAKLKYALLVFIHFYNKTHKEDFTK